MSIYDISNFINSKILNFIDNKEKFIIESVEQNDSDDYVTIF